MLSTTMKPQGDECQDAKDVEDVIRNDREVFQHKNDKCNTKNNRELYKDFLLEVDVIDRIVELVS